MGGVDYEQRPHVAAFIFVAFCFMKIL
eukprot:SAG31_NODE_34206_length_335_cov_1.055085_1_plen_26_part_01